uniref:Uncharacterized protein n=1 Tax=Fagus sylvatica TaxID=28930 RepID=A0A2N9EZ91_FAGSY
MPFFKNLMELPRTFTCTLISRSRTHLLLNLLLILTLFLLSSWLATHSLIVTATALASPFLFASNYVSSFSSISPSSTSFVTGLHGNWTLSSVSTIERTRWNSRKTQSDIISNLASCDIFDGTWVVDDTRAPLYPPGACLYIDENFNCFKNGRMDSDYLRYRWKPHGCSIPRFDGRKMLNMLRGKRLVFVGDSLSRNMWQSLICALRESFKDKSRNNEVFGRRKFRTKGFYSFRFRDYKCSIDFIKSPFLVQELKASGKTGTQRGRLRLDMIQGSSSNYHNADIIIFNTGHWWTHQKTFKGKHYFQEGSHVYDRLETKEAFPKALRTWAQWVDTRVDSNKTKVFFLGYSASHFRGGQWNSGGSCLGQAQPITNETYLASYPWMMNILESVLAEMKTPVFYLNVTKMTDYRKDGHPSIYRHPGMEGGHRKIQDCSHWCLPGVPDSWNELLFATLTNITP